MTRTQSSNKAEHLHNCNNDLEEARIKRPCCQNDEESLLKSLVAYCRSMPTFKGLPQILIKPLKSITRDLIREWKETAPLIPSGGNNLRDKRWYSMSDLRLNFSYRNQPLSITSRNIANIRYTIWDRMICLFPRMLFI